MRRQREAEAERAAREGRPYLPYEPVWFKKDKDPITGNPIHIYQVYSDTRNFYTKKFTKWLLVVHTLLLSILMPWFDMFRCAF